MKKRVLPLFLALSLVFTMLTATGFAARDEAVQAAETLNALGLFRGVGNNADGTPNFDLDRALTRQEAITMLVRLLGKDEEAKRGTWETPFTDVADWAKPYVGYAYANGLTTGTSATTFGGNAKVNATQYLTFVLRALGYESGKDFQWDKAGVKAQEAIKGYWNSSYKDATDFTRGDVAIISHKALLSYEKGTSHLLGETLNNPAFEYRGASIAELEGIWRWEADNGNKQELIIRGDTATYMLSNDIETVYQSGPITVTESGEIQWTSSEYYFYTPVMSGAGVSREEYENDAVRELEKPQIKGDVLNNHYRRVETSKLYETCYGIVDRYNRELSADEKEIVAQKLKDALGNQATATQSMQTALSYDGQLIVGSIGGMSSSKRLSAQNGMQKAEVAVMSSCFLVKADVADIRAILEKKSGTESLVKALKTLEDGYDRICNKTANTDHDQLMDMSDLLLVTSESLSEIQKIIWDRYFE